MIRDFSDKLLAWKDSPSRKPLLIQGVRQSGKTFSLLEFGNRYFSRVHYFNFEQNPDFAKIFISDLDPKRIIDELSFAAASRINLTEDMLILDEIQDCPPALTSLKYFQESMPELALAAAGSLLGVHLAGVSFPVGKVDMLRMYPMSFMEFLSALKEEILIDHLQQAVTTKKIAEIAHEKLWGLLKLYFIVGGLPEVVGIFRDNQDDLFSALEKVRIKQQELIVAYFADMAKHSGKVNALHLDRIWRAVPSQLAREQNSMAPKFKFKGVVPGVNRYSHLACAIDWLLAAGLVIKVPIVNCGQLPFAAYTKENSFKLFLNDVGLLGAMSGLSSAAILNYDYGTYKGYFAENFVAQELLQSGISNIYSWQEGRAELEFLREISGQVIPIEVKSGWITRSKSLQTFAAKYESPHKIILSANNLHIDGASKVLRLPLYLAGWYDRFKI